MLETIVVLKPRDQWPEQISTRELIARFDAVMQFPGVSNSWTMPVRGRIDMLSTGMRSPLGLKIAGPGIARIQQLGIRVEELLRSIPGSRSVFAERLNDGRYIDVQWRRDALAQAGIPLDDAQATIQNAIGGDNVTTLIQGRARLPVNVRLPRDARSNLDALKQIPVSASTGGDPTPLGQLADVRVVQGPSMIRNENGMLTGYVYVDPGDRDPAGYIAEASQQIARQVKLPAGYTLTWSGQYEAYQRVSRRLLQVVPLTLALIALLVYWNTRSAPKTALVLLAVPFSAIGGVWSLWLLGYPLSPAVWVGVIALLGVDAETGMFMLLYLDLAWRKLTAEGRTFTPADLRDAVLAGAVRRIRPKFMTVATMFLGLAPVLWSTGAGAEVMKRIAAPMVGGLATSFLMELIVYPVLYERWRSRHIAAQPD
jgi:Cu(I)/Ag(I) efflux system membrane protein CusA/SilA